MSDEDPSMNLLLVTSSFPLDPQDGKAAAGLFVADFAQAFAARGHRVVVATPDRPGDKADWDGLDVRWIEWRGGDKPLVQIKPHRAAEWAPLFDLGWHIPRRIEAIARQTHADAVLAFWAVPSGWWATRLKRRLRIPVATWCLGTDVRDLGRVPVLKGVIRRVLTSSDAVYANSHALRELADALYGGPCGFLASGRVLDESLIAPIEGELVRPLFYYLGRFLEVKGPDVLVEAMIQYLERGGRGSLVMHGGGPLRERLAERIEAAGVDRAIQIEDYVPESRAVSYLAACDMRIIPSRAESMPVSYTDALQLRKPLIVTDCG